MILRHFTTVTATTVCFLSGLFSTVRLNQAPIVSIWICSHCRIEMGKVQLTPNFSRKILPNISSVRFSAFCYSAGLQLNFGNIWCCFLLAFEYLHSIKLIFFAHMMLFYLLICLIHQHSKCN